MQQPIIQNEPLLNFKEAMAYLRVSRSTLLRFMGDGKIPAHKVGRGWRFYASELQQAITPVSITKAEE